MRQLCRIYGLSFKVLYRVEWSKNITVLYTEKYRTIVSSNVRKRKLPYIKKYIAVHKNILHNVVKRYKNNTLKYIVNKLYYIKLYYNTFQNNTRHYTI